MTSKQLNAEHFKAPSVSVVTARLNNFRGKSFEFEMLSRNIVRRNAVFVSKQLGFMPGKHARALRTLIDSCIANAAHNNNLDPANMYVKTVSVSRGKYLKRIEFKGRGRTGRVWKPSANVLVELQGVELGK